MTAEPTMVLLKRDALGRVELLEGAAGKVVRRVACGGRVLGSRLVARGLLRRERRALEALAALEESAAGELPVPRLVRGDGGPDRGELLRSWIPGLALHRATELPVDFFDLLDELVCAMHGCGVCHNDLHKEQNILVGEDGRPCLVDFQLASVHRRVPPGRAREDLRHVQKHRRRYTRGGRGPAGLAELDGTGEGTRVQSHGLTSRGLTSRGLGHGLERGLSARLWRRFVKPIYRRVTNALGRRDWEERRPSSGPWPNWTGPVGRR